MNQDFDKKKQRFFTKKLLEWFAQNDRPLPWLGEKNPYLVWLSEIILQQTRVEQGLPYFERFRAKYPTVADLANAPEDEVMKLWEGLGYYSRARNLHFTAKHISHELGGVFPSEYSAILKLKGVGPYTAAAIASFAFGLPHAVVDGNVYRVLSRVFGIETPIDSTAGKKIFATLAQALLEETQPGKYNQAIMDFGATHCTPAQPNCSRCPMLKECAAFHYKKINQLPVKSKRVQKKQRFFNYLIFNENETVILRKRIEKDIWRDLYEFPLVESSQLIQDKAEIVDSEVWKKYVGAAYFQFKKVSIPFKQTLTHQKIVAVFWEVTLKTELTLLENMGNKVKRKNLTKFAFPKIIDLYLKDNSLTLELL